MPVLRPPMSAASTPEVRLAVLATQALIRECLGRVLASAGVQIVGESGDSAEFIQLIDQSRPRVAVIDVAGRLEETIALVERLHQLHPDVGILVLADDIGPGVVD